MRKYLALLFLILSSSVHALQPSEILPDSALESRARTLGKDLRCLVCQNQSIDDSDSDLAHDLRVLVRQRLEAGDTDAEVIKYLVDRYGDYILLRPPLKANTLVLWLGPGLFFVLALGATFVFYRRRTQDEETTKPLSLEETRRLAAIQNTPDSGDEKGSD